MPIGTSRKLVLIEFSRRNEPKSDAMVEITMPSERAKMVLAPSLSTCVMGTDSVMWMGKAGANRTVEIKGLEHCSVGRFRSRTAFPIGTTRCNQVGLRSFPTRSAPATAGGAAGACALSVRLDFPCQTTQEPHRNTATVTMTFLVLAFEISASPPNLIRAERADSVYAPSIDSVHTGWDITINHPSS